MSTEIKYVARCGVKVGNGLFFILNYTDSHCHIDFFFFFFKFRMIIVLHDKRIALGAGYLGNDQGGSATRTSFHSTTSWTHGISYKKLKSL